MCVNYMDYVCSTVLYSLFVFLFLFFVCSFVCLVQRLTRIHSYGDVTITGEGLQLLTYT